ncbi:dienelactone hydrolase family protein [Caulobacter vibrioides]|uniref:dienelactone hydrolase family protein n=1 Tax=Caulobacter vibrioides TaxID=155892 RepID=UPI000BB492C0|nr:dienelactone hydrolase family protein [Caulobacter vibrioides]ATC23490.1 dienelactone hydrolase family protein [Caulobacter vibrioides]AZH11706.1 dienelactone hydrolase family protein [Caulobacter vibrioides]PLR11923.1 dienelactone hydrolase family protein [Caulobacter vibrioides]
MGERIALATREGAPLAAYHAPPLEARRGGIVMLHAIWGVTPHLRQLSDSLAEQGYEVMLPSLMDAADAAFPVEDTTPSILDARMAMGERTGWGASTLPRVQACIDALNGPVYAMGFCYGGTTAWLAACRCEGLSAVSAFYGGDIAAYRDETPKVPTILHFGKTDTMIPLSDVDAVRDHHPDLPVYLYDAGHAFVAPSGHHPDSARLALLRTLQLFQRSSGTRAEA